jgi:CubicO group peptidase (beta-lactamase class C family)
MERWLASALDYIPSWIDFQVQQFQQPGCLLAVVHDGKVVLEHATGLANLRTGEKLTPRHRFRIASHSKSFTAAGILKLREQNKLGLDDPVGKYVSGLHRGVAEARLAHVLSHGAGITRDGDDSSWFVGRKSYPDRAKLMEILSGPPLIEAGTRLKYSNPGFALLGQVIETVTGEPYAKWIEREVVRPAGLRHTSADGPLRRGTPFARGHTALMPLGRRLALKGDEPLRAMAPAGGFVSTAADTALFFNQLNPASRKSVLSRASRRDMVHRQWRNMSAIESYYGYGLQSAPIAGGWNSFGHGGALLGYLSRTATVQEIGVTISIMANSADAWSHIWVDGVANILRTLANNGAPTRRARDWTGRWWSPWGAYDMVPAGDKVLLAGPGFVNPFFDHGVLEVTGRDTGKVTVSAGYGIVGEAARRVRNKAGKVVEMRIGSGRSTSEARNAAALVRQFGSRRRG